ETGAPILEMSPCGAGRGLSAGETVVLVRYLDQQVAVRVALIPERKPTERLPWVSSSAARRPRERGTHSDGSPWASFVDHHIDAKLQRLKLPASPICDDTTFLRRAFLDLTGVLPTADEARSFVGDTSPGKRMALV